MRRLISKHKIIWNMQALRGLTAKALGSQPFEQIRARAGGVLEVGSTKPRRTARSR